MVEQAQSLGVFMKRVQIIDEKIRSIAQRERGLLAELIEYLRELDGVRGYVDLGFSSLFDYLTKAIGYSAGSAQRRIDAARLSKDVPDLGERLESGRLDLHHVSTVSKAVRQASKERKVTASEKCYIFAQLETQTEAKTQKAVAEFFDLEVITHTKKSIQKDESVRYQVTMSREDDELLKQAQALLSHAVPTSNLVDFIRYVSEKIIKEKATPARKYVKATATVEVDSTSTVAVTPVPERVHREVRSMHPACVDCGSFWFPQTDHRQPRWAGGSNERENLVTRCGPCNRAKYRHESGVRAVSAPRSELRTTDKNYTV
jgi:hypothetical protein